MRKLIRITTTPISLKILLRNQLSFMNNYYQVIGISNPGRELEEVSKNEGIEVIPINMKRHISLLDDLKSVIELYKVFRKEKPFIVHSHTPKAGTVGMFAAWLAGVPNRLHTVAGLPLMESSGKLRVILKIVEKYTYKFATQIYPNSQGLMNFIISEKLCSVYKIKILGNGSSNGIDTNYFNPENITSKQYDNLRSKLHIEKNDFIFIFIGRLVKDKGINELVWSFDKLSLKYQNIKLLLVGEMESELDPLAEETIHTIQTNNRIITVGFQPDVRPFFAISNILVFPSYREGFPNVVMQAGAMGLPSIVTNINGCNEIIKEGVNGAIIPVKEEQALLEKMEKLMSDTDVLKNLSRHARKMITSRYEQRLIWEAILQEYETLQNKGKAYV